MYVYACVLGPSIGTLSLLIIANHQPLALFNYHNYHGVSARKTEICTTPKSMSDIKKNGFKSRLDLVSNFFWR